MRWPPEILSLVEAAEARRQSALIPIDLFLAGNNDEGSLGCNLVPHPGMDRFRALFGEITGHADVSGAWAEITDADRDLDWPFTDTIWVSTGASDEQLERWREQLEADEFTTPGPRDPISKFKLPHGQRVVGFWWD